jgi:hypothetical protein
MRQERTKNGRIRCGKFYIYMADISEHDNAQHKYLKIQASEFKEFSNDIFSIQFF